MSKLRAFFSSVSSVLLLLALLRLVSLGFPNLFDSTDARYASISATMAVSDNWTVPYVHQEGEMMAYWSKPPLAFWVQAGSLRIFGLNEWAARFPGFLWLALTVALTAFLGERWLGTARAGLIAVLLASSPLFFAFSSITMTDHALIAALVGAMVCFGIFFESMNRWWGRAAFFCLGLALLAKGPIGLMMPGVSLAAWVIVTRSWHKVFKIPWITGLSIMLAVAAPWYCAMETAQPGFLKYFLIDENLKRLISGHLHLRHGNLHETFRGFAIIGFVIVTIPWIFLVLRWGTQGGWSRLLPMIKVTPNNEGNSESKLINQREWFLLCWFAAPLVPLAIGKQVLPYYLLPLLPGFILWLVMVGNRLVLIKTDLLIRVAGISAVVYSILLLIAGPLFVDALRSTKPMIAALAKRFGEQSRTIVFGDRVPDSAFFYLISDVSKNLRFAALPIDRLAKTASEQWIVVRAQDLNTQNFERYIERKRMSKWVLLERK